MSKIGYDIIVIGGGPAGLSAAVNARARNRSVLVITNDHRKNPLYLAHQVDNYLGMPGCSGSEMLDIFWSHALAAGAEIKIGRATNILPMGGKCYVNVEGDMLEAGAVILAAGVARGRKYPGEESLLGRGVSYCATCDGMLYRGKRVAVIGGNPEAPAEAEFLRTLGCAVRYVAKQRPPELNSEISFLKEKNLEIKGDQVVTGLSTDGQDLAVEGIFILRATLAPTDLLPGLALESGYLSVDREMKTNLPGVFAAGDCTGQPLQVSKAVGEGLVAAQRAAEYLEQFTK